MITTTTSDDSTQTQTAKKSLTQIKDWWEEARVGLEEENRRFKENFQFYIGGDYQWDEAVIIQLDNEGRPHLSLNKCMPTINLISGYQRRYRESLSVLPRRGGTTGAATILTELGRHSVDMSRPNGDFVNSEMFFMGCIGGKWWSGIDLDYSYDVIDGDIRFSSWSCFDVHEDPLFRGYDVNRNDPLMPCRFIFQSRWLELDQIAMLYPDKKLDIEDYHGALGELTPRSGHVRVGALTAANDTDDYSTDMAQIGSDPNLRGGMNRQYRLRRCWYKTWKQHTYMLHKGTNAVWDVTERVPTARRLAEELDQLVILPPRPVPTLHYQDFLCDLELTYQADPLYGLCEYPLFRFCPYWLDGYTMGLLDNLKDPQKELNKRRSQMLHHLNQSANSGFQYERGTLTSEQAENYERNASRAGFLGEYEPNHAKPEKIVPTPLSDGHLKAALLAEDDFEKITNLNTATRGTSDGRGVESGEALKTRREQGLTSNEGPFDHFNFTQQQQYMHLVERIRKPDENGRTVYSAEEIAQIVDQRNLTVGPEAIGEIGLGRYGLKVSEDISQPTQRREQLNNLLGIIEKVPALQEEIDTVDIIEMSDHPRREQLIAKIQQRRQMVAEMNLAGGMGGDAGGVGVGPVEPESQPTNLLTEPNQPVLLSAG